MIRVTVMYPKNEHDRFDMNYYLDRHLPLVEMLYKPYGLKYWQVDQGENLSSRMPATMEVIAILYFDNIDQVKQAFKNKGAEVSADIGNFTKTTPQMIVSSVLKASEAV